MRQGRAGRAWQGTAEWVKVPRGGAEQSRAERRRARGAGRGSRHARRKARGARRGAPGTGSKTRVGAQMRYAGCGSVGSGRSARGVGCGARAAERGRWAQGADTRREGWRTRCKARGADAGSKVRGAECDLDLDFGEQVAFGGRKATSRTAVRHETPRRERTGAARRRRGRERALLEQVAFGGDERRLVPAPSHAGDFPRPRAPRNAAPGPRGGRKATCHAPALCNTRLPAVACVPMRAEDGSGRGEIERGEMRRCGATRDQRVSLRGSSRGEAEGARVGQDGRNEEVPGNGGSDETHRKARNRSPWTESRSPQTERRSPRTEHRSPQTEHCGARPRSTRGSSKGDFPRASARQRPAGHPGCCGRGEPGRGGAGRGWVGWGERGG